MFLGLTPFFLLIQSRKYLRFDENEIKNNFLNSLTNKNSSFFPLLCVLIRALSWHFGVHYYLLFRSEQNWLLSHLFDLLLGCIHTISNLVQKVFHLSSYICWLLCLWKVCLHFDRSILRSLWFLCWLCFCNGVLDLNTIRHVSISGTCQSSNSGFLIMVCFFIVSGI